MTSRLDNVVRLRKTPNGVAEALRSTLASGRNEIVSNGPNPEFHFIGSDPYNTNAYTGLVVPTTPSSDINDARYLFLLARESFSAPEQSSSRCGVRLVGIRQYAELIARIPPNTPPLPEQGGPTGITVFRKEITGPMWHPQDGNISWHVVTIAKTRRDTRNPQNADGLIYQDALSPAMLYQTITGTALAPTAYTAPNGGRPWGKMLGASLGNIHELRYPWRTDRAERVLDIPIPTPCDVCLFASVRQNDPATNPTLDTTDCAFFSALSEEDRFVAAYHAFAQYGIIAGSLVFDQNLGEDVP
jgi:hypothetical protein